MSKNDIVNEFKKHLISFLDECIEFYPGEPDFVMARIYVSTQCDIIYTINTLNFLLQKNNGEFINMIKDRNEKFFIDHNIFGDLLGNEKSNHFKRIWNSSVTDEENKTVIWEWIDLFVSLTEKYTKLKN